MIEKDVIIVGGGPSGATLGWKLKERGISFLILDKKEFPREKACAGWITPHVLRILKISPKDYPYSIKKIRKLIFFVKGKKIVVPTLQYAIRRYEFDEFLLKRAGQRNFIKHEVKNITKFRDSFIIDDTYRAKILVGAGGTYCPVRKKFFKGSGLIERGERIVAMEDEFRWNCDDKNAYLWFFENDLSGYSWYFPKEDGYLNIGIGGKVDALRKKGETIKEHWELFIESLYRKGLTGKKKWNPKGHQYYLLGKIKRAYNNGAYLIGDSLGVSTLDMGEGIENSIRTAIQLYKAIVSGKTFKPKIKKFSITGIILPFL